MRGAWPGRRRVLGPAARGCPRCSGSWLRGVTRCAPAACAALAALRQDAARMIDGVALRATARNPVRLGCAQGAGQAKPPAPWPATSCHSTGNPPGPRSSGCRQRARCRLAGGRQARRMRTARSCCRVRFAAKSGSQPSRTETVLRSLAGHCLPGRGAKLSAHALCAAEERRARGRARQRAPTI